MVVCHPSQATGGGHPYAVANSGLVAHLLPAPLPLHPQIIACASLFLAGKAQNEAKPHTTLANELIKAWYGKDNPQLKALAAAHQATQAAQQQQRGGGFASPAVPPGVDFNFYTNMWAAVLEAERALLYTVGFDFNVELIHTYLARLCNRPRMKAVKLDKNKYFQQQLVSMANDVYKKDGTLALQVGRGYFCGWGPEEWAPQPRATGGHASQCDSGVHFWRGLYFTTSPATTLLLCVALT